MKAVELAKELKLPVETVAAAMARIKRREAVAARLKMAQAANTNAQRGLNWLDETALLAALVDYGKYESGCGTHTDKTAPSVEAGGSESHINSSEDVVVTVDSDPDYVAYNEAVMAAIKARGSDPYLSSSEDDVVAVGHESGYDAKETAGKILFDRRSGFEH